MSHAYSQAVESGKYERNQRLLGKYDNVRLYWEDELTRTILRPELLRLLQTGDRDQDFLRILDLGCGSGDGYELLLHTLFADPPMDESNPTFFTEASLDLYKGIELNQDLLDQNEERWGHNPKMECVRGDFSQGLPIDSNDQSFHIYLTTYGTLSHLTEPETVRLFQEILDHAENGALVVGDWLGRYSYEWQELWEVDCSSEQWMDYLISYIYTPEERSQQALDSLRLRLLSPEEIHRITEQVNTIPGKSLNLINLYDRSVFVGRHMDTGDYNHRLSPKRKVINSLFQRDRRTPLDDLLITYNPHPEFTRINEFFKEFHQGWNTLIEFTQELCRPGPHSIPSENSLPVSLQQAADSLATIIQHSNAFPFDDVRANVLEPQLALALRNLEFQMQEGLGAAHGLVGIFRVEK